MDTIYLTVYRQFIEAVDAIDNGNLICNQISVLFVCPYNH